MVAMGDAQAARIAAIERRFPGLVRTHFRITSPEDQRYNCAAWAAGETHRNWHPASFGGLYWPGGAAGDDLGSWVLAFSTLGYERCDSRALEPGFEKVAIYGTADFPLHVARQLQTGYWTSKLGPREDVEHELLALEGEEYGRVLAVLSRPVATRPGNSQAVSLPRL